MKELTLKQLKRLKPEELLIESPSQDRLWEQHLLWLMDNEPERTWELFEQDPDLLAEKLLRVLQRADLLQAVLEKEDKLDADQIAEQVNLIVSPSDGRALMQDPAPAPLSDKQRSRLLSWSRNLP
jgi:hypothetical protein